MERHDTTRLLYPTVLLKPAEYAAFPVQSEFSRPLLGRSVCSYSTDVYTDVY